MRALAVQYFFSCIHKCTRNDNKGNIQTLKLFLFVSSHLSSHPGLLPSPLLHARLTLKELTKCIFLDQKMCADKMNYEE